jgi:hypothetical protein
MPIREDLRRNFLNPPKGGNGVGMPTINRMAPVLVPQEGGGGVPAGGGDSLGAQASMRKLSSFEHLTGPQAQTSLRASLEAGEASARGNIMRSARVGQTELRNLVRGNTPSQSREDDPQGPDHYDFEQASEGTPYAGSGMDGGRLGKNPTLQLEPSTEPINAYRSDGKRPLTTKQTTRR